MANRRPFLRRPSFGYVDIACDHPDDPICILSLNDDDDGDSDEELLASLPAMPNRRGGSRGIGRESSFFAKHPLFSFSTEGKKKQGSSYFSNLFSFKKKKLPIVKINHTSRDDMNGKYGWVHSYSKNRDRYAVTLLDCDKDDNKDPSKIYFGLADVKKLKKSFENSTSLRSSSRYLMPIKSEEDTDTDEEPSLQEEPNGAGSKRLNGLNHSKKSANKSKDAKNRKPEMIPQAPTFDASSTLFLPPTTLSHLETMDIVNFYIKRIALHQFSMPRMARSLKSMMDFVEHALLPCLRIETLGVFFLLMLPVSLARIYKRILSTWILYSQPIVVDVRGASVLDGSASNSMDGVGATNNLMNSSSTLTHIIAAPYLHPMEFVTLLLLLVGTNTIARFLLSEYHLVKRKAEAMTKRTNIHENGSAASGNSDSSSSSEGFTRFEMFEYRVDYYFSTSKWAKVVLLLSFTFVLIAVGAGLLAVCLDDHSISNAVWIAWTYVADPGTHADAPEGFFTRSISFSITVGGMLIFALMIGIISDSIGDKVDDLKKGKSRIIESDHTIMLGWNDKSLAIIQQIALANESEGGGTIVVLADDEKEHLEGRLISAVESKENPIHLLGTEVIFRSGNPLMECELRRVSANTARSVVALSSDDLDPDEADSNMVRQVMALKAFHDFAETDCHVVVEVNDVDNKELFSLVAPDFAEVVVTHDIIGRLMLQCARCPGLATVLEEMMGFEGSEFYLEEWPELVGKTFFDITCLFDDAIPIGIKSCDGQVFINPENDHIINDGDKILVLAEDNDSYEINDGSYKIQCKGSVPNFMGDEKKLEKIMFLGWRRDMADMISQLDEYVEKGSELWLFNSVPSRQRCELLKDKGNKEEVHLKNLAICNVVGNPIIRRDLNRIEAVDDEGNATGKMITLDQFDSILILADAVAMENGANMMSCDSRSLSSLLIIQDIQKKLYEKKKKICPDAKPPCAPISEILDSRTKSLLKVANCKGYIMSNQIISSVMAQVSEDKDINIVLREILTAEGSETYMRNVSRFIDVEKEGRLSFWDIALRARQVREVAVGYKPEDMEFQDAGHLIINPPEKFVPRKWASGDMIVTFALE